MFVCISVHKPSAGHSNIHTLHLQTHRERHTWSHGCEIQAYDVFWCCATPERIAAKKHSTARVHSCIVRARAHILTYAHTHTAHTNDALHSHATTRRPNDRTDARTLRNAVIFMLAVRALLPSTDGRTPVDRMRRYVWANRTETIAYVSADPFRAVCLQCRMDDGMWSS